MTAPDAAAGQRSGRAPAVTLPSLPLAGLLTQMSSAKPGPAAGSAAAVTVGLAAALTGKTARLSSGYLPETETLVCAADSARDRALELAGADAAAVTAMLTPDTSEPPEHSGGSGTAGHPGEPGTAVPPDPRRTAEPRPRGAEATDPNAIPRQIGELAGEVTRLAAQLSESGNPRLRADAITAHRLAESAGAAIEAIMDSNCGLGGTGS